MCVLHVLCDRCIGNATCKFRLRGDVNYTFSDKLCKNGETLANGMCKQMLGTSMNGNCSIPVHRRRLVVTGYCFDEMIGLPFTNEQLPKKDVFLYITLFDFAMSITFLIAWRILTVREPIEVCRTEKRIAYYFDTWHLRFAHYDTG